MTPRQVLELEGSLGTTPSHSLLLLKKKQDPGSVGLQGLPVTEGRGNCNCLLSLKCNLICRFPPFSVSFWEVSLCDKGEVFCPQNRACTLCRFHPHGVISAALVVPGFCVKLYLRRGFIRLWCDWFLVGTLHRCSYHLPSEGT